MSISSVTPADGEVGECAPPPSIESLTAVLDVVELQAWGDPSAAFDRAVTLEAKAVGLGSEELRLRAQLVQADVEGRRGQTVASARTLRSINRWATEQTNSHLLARSHRLLGVFFLDMGDDTAFLEHALRGVELLSPDCSDGLRADHLLVLGTAQIRTGYFDSGRENFAVAEALATRAGDIGLQVRAINNQAYLEHVAGQHDVAVRTAERVVALAELHGIALGPLYLDTIVRVYLEVGRYAEAELVLTGLIDDATADSLSGAGSDASVIAESTLTLAEVRRRRGDSGSATATLQRCRQICQSGNLGGIMVRVRGEQAELYATQGRFREAFEELKAFNRDSVELNSSARAARAETLQAVFDVDQVRRTSQHFEEMSLRDPLTGLYNRRFVDNRLPMLLGPGGGDQQRPVSVAFIDLDHFKRINDTLSHDIGDRVLQQVGFQLGEAPGTDGFAARMGGEEFLLVLPDLDHTRALRICEELQATIRKYPWHTITGEVPVRASIGLTTAFAACITQAELLVDADRNVYAAKAGGRDRIVSTDLRTVTGPSGVTLPGGVSLTSPAGDVDPVPLALRRRTPAAPTARRTVRGNSPTGSASA